MNQVVNYVLFQCKQQRLAFAVHGPDVWAVSAAHVLLDGLTPDEATELVSVLQKVAHGQYNDVSDMPTVHRWSDQQVKQAKTRQGYRLFQAQPWLWQYARRTIRSLQRVAPPAVRGVLLIPVAGAIDAWEQDAIAAQRKLQAAK